MILYGIYIKGEIEDGIKGEIEDGSWVRGKKLHRKAYVQDYNVRFFCEEHLALVT